MNLEPQLANRLSGCGWYIGTISWFEDFLVGCTGFHPEALDVSSRHNFNNEIVSAENRLRALEVS